MTTSTTRLNLKTSWNRLRLVELHQQTFVFGIFLILQVSSLSGHDIWFWLVGLHRRWCGQFLAIPHQHEAKDSRGGSSR
jgi:hypothetical protein